MRIVCVSDTHNHTDALVVPEGDVLVHAGDLTGRGRNNEIAHAGRWLASLPHPHKIVIAGNHDFGFQMNPGIARQQLGHGANGITYLQDEGITIDGIQFWGSPWQPWFYDWAFNLPRGPKLAAVWAKIPENTDVLLTHGPPYGIQDMTARGEAVGCHDLATRVLQVRPKLHVFGHIHEAAGMACHDGTTYVNAALCNLRYQPVQTIHVAEIP